MNLSQAKLMPKQLNLNKLGDPGGSQIHWSVMLEKTDSSSYFGITKSPEFLRTNSEVAVILRFLDAFRSRDFEITIITKISEVNILYGYASFFSLSYIV